MTEKKEFLLRLPTYLYDIMKEYKERTGIPMTHQIIECIYRQFMIKGFIKPEDIRKEK